MLPPINTSRYRSCAWSHNPDPASWQPPLVRRVSFAEGYSCTPGIRWRIVTRISVILAQPGTETAGVWMVPAIHKAPYTRLPTPQRMHRTEQNLPNKGVGRERKGCCRNGHPWGGVGEPGQRRVKRPYWRQKMFLSRHPRAVLRNSGMSRDSCFVSSQSMGRDKLPGHFHFERGNLK